MKLTYLITIAFALQGCYSKEPEKTGLEGKELPSFTLLLADSSTYLKTDNIQKGKPSVFFYFGPYCPYSHAQMKDILEDINESPNVHYYVFTRWPYKDMMSFYNKFKLQKYSNITVGVDYKHSFVDYFKVTGVPYTAIFNDKKKLIKAFEGKIYNKQIKEILSK